MWLEQREQRGEREEGRAERERGIQSSGEPLESGAVIPHPTAQMNRMRLIDKDLLFPSLGREPGVPGDVERLHPDRGGGWSGRPLPPSLPFPTRPPQKSSSFHPSVPKQAPRG